MKKKYLFLSSVGLAAFVLTSCGGNGLGTKISTADAKTVAKTFDARGEDIVMGSETVKLSVNSFSFSGDGVIGYINTKKGSTLQNYHLSGASFEVDKQDIANLDIPNILLETSLSEKISWMYLPYILSATISEKMIDTYTSYVDTSGKEKGWDNLTTTFYKNKTKNNNEALSATVEINDIIKFVDEYAAAGFTTKDLPFKGNGSLKATVKSDDLGYITKFNLVVKGDNMQIESGIYKEENDSNDVDPGIIDPFFQEGTTITGCNINGNINIDVSLDIAHNEATQKTVKFYRQNKKYNTEKKIFEDDGDPVEITDLEKDEILEFASIEEVKYDPLTKKHYYGKKNVAYDEISYNIGFKVKDDKKYIIGDDAFEQKYTDNPYSLSYGGIVVDQKERNYESMFDFGYRYFSNYDYESINPDPELSDKGYKTFHCGRNVLHELSKLGDANLEITINAYPIVNE